MAYAGVFRRRPLRTNAALIGLVTVSMMIAAATASLAQTADLKIARQKTSTYPDGHKGIQYFNQAGQEVKMEWYDSCGRLSGSREPHGFYTNGQVTGQTVTIYGHLDALGKDHPAETRIRSRIIEKFDSKGQQIESTEYSGYLYGSHDIPLFRRVTKKSQDGSWTGVDQERKSPNHPWETERTVSGKSKEAVDAALNAATANETPTPASASQPASSPCDVTPVGSKTPTKTQPGKPKKATSTATLPARRTKQATADSREPASAPYNLSVPGRADIHLAGQPNGSVLSGDSAPANAPIEIGALQAGTRITLSATGATCNDPGACARSPNGGEGAGGVGGSSNFGLSAIAGFPINALVGVFLGPHKPDPVLTPPALNANQGFSSATPVLQQVFFIGAGPRSFTVPKGATRLFLGSTDTPGTNYNNPGSFVVSVISASPEGTRSTSIPVENTLPDPKRGKIETRSSLTGDWGCAGSACGITQDGEKITIVNAADGTSTGKMQGDTIVADQGGLRGTVSKDRNSIAWSNGTKWTRRTGTSSSGSSGGGNRSSSSAGPPPEFQPCSRNSAGSGDTWPCLGPQDTTIYLVLHKPLKTAPVKMFFTRNMAYSTGGSVTVNLQGSGVNYQATAPAALCMGNAPHTYWVGFLDAAGKVYPAQGQFTITNCR